MYLHAWKQGLKTTYYLRSRPATRIQQTTTAATTGAPPPGASVTPLVPPDMTEAQALACSIENPDACEACQ